MRTNLQTKKIHKNQAGTATTQQSQNELDHVGRVKKVFDGINTSPTEIVKNDYDEIGRLSQKKIFPNNTFVAGGTKEFIERPLQGIVTQANTVDLARRYVLLEPTTDIKAISLNSYLAKIDHPNAPQGVNINGLQTINFAWHLRGGLLGINLDNNGNAIPKTSEGDLFSYKLDYESAGFYDGNIGKQYWQSANDQNQAIGLRSYALNYDPLKRMTGANFAGINSENYSIPNISYDKNGNITNLQRKGKSNGTYTDIDNLSYNYNGNQLVGVTDGINGNEDVGDFRDNGSNSDYTYWTDGSLKSDANKGITLIEYDTFLKKVKQINIGSNWIKFFYDGSGILIRRSNSLGDVWDYCPNGMIYKNGQPYQLPTPEGRAVYVAGQWIYEFEYRDVWGNLRVGFKANGNHLEATQKNDYDITGFELKPLAYENIATKNNFKFQNQERIADLGLDIDFFKFRPSDSKIVRFWQTDPLASDYPHNSVYALQENKFGMGVELEGKELLQFYFIQKYIEWKGNTAQSFQNVNGAVSRLTNGTSGNVPSNVHMNPMTRAMIRNTAKVSDISTVSKETRKVAAETVITGSQVVQDFGDAVETAGIATGQPEIAATGGAISDVGTIAEIGGQAMKGESVKGKIGYEMGKKVVFGGLSNYAEKAADSGTLAKQANNVYQGVVHSWEKITDWVKDKISDSEESKKQK